MTSRQKRALRAAGLPTPEPPKPPEPERSSLCADTAESGGCYHFKDGAEREECRAACRMLNRGRTVAVGSGRGRFALAVALALASSGRRP